MYFIYLIIVLLISFFLTPIVSIVSRKINVVDRPGGRHIHQKITPRMGGLAIYSAFMIGSALFLKVDQQLFAVLLGGAIIAVSGFLDDLISLSPKMKLLFQIVATLVVIFYGGVRIDNINIGFFSFDFGFLSILITIIWIIGITNAVNLIDGLDGLCVGVSSIILATLATLSFMQGRMDIVLICLILLGSSLGFLYYNFHPASIFMGDTGSLFIGFMIATISLLGFKSTAILTLGPAIFILAIPILDTFLSIIRRKLKGVAITSPDKEHLHHTLMFKLNLGQRKTVIIIYLITFYFSQVAYVYLLNKIAALYMLIFSIIIIEIFIEKTEMISSKYQPILGLGNRIKKVIRRCNK